MQTPDLRRDVRLIREPLVADQVTRELLDAGCGALTTFVGVVRDQHHGRPVSHLEYSAHPTMAQAQLERIVDQLADRWPIRAAALVHRLGRLDIGEASVVVAVASPHRDAAFAACRFAIETLKAEVPIWKKEFYLEGEPEWIGAR